MKKNIRTLLAVAATLLALGAATYAIAAEGCCVQPEVNNCCAAGSSCCN
ncbi:hypothetical protein [Geotalea sp. SG265]|nr:hypothetical protein [Geotalea sp. SG265]